MHARNGNQEINFLIRWETEVLKYQKKILKAVDLAISIMM